MASLCRFFYRLPRKVVLLASCLAVLAILHLSSLLWSDRRTPGGLKADPRQGGGGSSRETWSELKARRERVERVCQSLGTPRLSSRINGVHANDTHRLAYCYVPKTGCTYWKQIFTFINNDFNGLKTPVRSPFDIPRLFIHTHDHAKGWDLVKAKVNGTDYLRFMFTRDPYSRLWSSYLDKFYLPDFWKLFGRSIVRLRRPVVSNTTLACGSDVTFPEFVQFALRNREPHWTPTSEVCDPCRFKPQVLGKMETYARDAQAILERSNLTWVLERSRSSNNNSSSSSSSGGGETTRRNEVRMLMTYNLAVVHSKHPELSRHCISDQDLGGRLWTTFQHNGYILTSLRYVAPFPFSGAALEKSVVEAVDESARRPGAHEELKIQKVMAMRDAFRQLSPETMRKIADLYRVDFEMFGYEPMTFDFERKGGW